MYKKPYQIYIKQSKTVSWGNWTGSSSKTEKKKISNKGKNRVSLFFWYTEFDFQYILFSHFKDLTFNTTIYT